MSLRNAAITFRLCPPNVSGVVEIKLTQEERAAVVEGSKGAPISTFLRELVSEATKRGKGETPLARAQDRADSAGMALNAYLRLLVLSAMNVIALDDDVALARRWLRK